MFRYTALVQDDLQVPFPCASATTTPLTYANNTTPERSFDFEKYKRRLPFEGAVRRSASQKHVLVLTFDVYVVPFKFHPSAFRNCSMFRIEDV